MAAEVFTLYDTGTGRVLQSGRVDRADLLEAQPVPEGVGLLAGVRANGRTERIENGAAVRRPTVAFDKTTITADAADTAILSGLPDSCKIFIDGEEYEILDGELNFRADVAGVYRIRVPDFLSDGTPNIWPSQSFNVEMTAT